MKFRLKNRKLFSLKDSLDALGFRKILTEIPPAWVLVGSLCLTFFGVALNIHSEFKLKRSSFNALTSDFSAMAEKRLQIYLNVLEATQGLFLANDSVNLQQFRTFVSIFDLGHKYPGIQGIGFTARLNEVGLRHWKSELKKQGRSEFDVWPRDDRKDFTAIVYLEPEDWRNKRALGFDMSSEKVRWTAMKKAMESGLPAASGRVTLVQETNKDRQAGFLIYFPLYKKGEPTATMEQRTKALLGFVYSPFRIGDLFSQIYRELGHKDELIKVGVYEAETMDLAGQLYSSEKDPFFKTEILTHSIESPKRHEIKDQPEIDSITKRSESVPLIVQMAEILGVNTTFADKMVFDIAGKKFYFHISASPDFLRSADFDLSLIFGVLGIVLSFLIYYVVKIVNEANRAKGDFLANMSHEIRTPLGAVMGYSDLLALSDLTNEERDTYVRIIKRNGDLLSNIINDILDFSKIEAGKLEVSRGETHLKEILEDVEKLYRGQALKKGIELVVHSGDSLPEVIITDSLRLRQILLNLVGNALKFTEKGFITLKTEVGVRDDGRRLLRFNVRDTGGGIDPDRVQNLFQPFTQADETINRKFGGTGLGLVLSKRLANLLGGDVELIENNFGQGCLFSVTIGLEVPPPLSHQEEKSLLHLSKKSIGPFMGSLQQQADEGLLRGRQILVVDDSLDNQLLVSRMLGRLGVDVQTASNGKEGLDKIHGTNFDAILMDLQMPVLNGYQALNEMKKEGLKTPVIAFSAHALNDVKENCLNVGFSGHISKPVDKRVLIETVAGVLDGANSPSH